MAVSYKRGTPVPGAVTRVLLPSVLLISGGLTKNWAFRFPPRKLRRFEGISANLLAGLEARLGRAFSVLHWFPCFLPRKKHKVGNRFVPKTKPGSVCV